MEKEILEVFDNGRTLVWFKPLPSINDIQYALVTMEVKIAFSRQMLEALDSPAQIVKQEAYIKLRQGLEDFKENMKKEELRWKRKNQKQLKSLKKK